MIEYTPYSTMGYHQNEQLTKHQNLMSGKHTWIEVRIAATS